MSIVRVVQEVRCFNSTREESAFDRRNGIVPASSGYLLVIEGTKLGSRIGLSMRNQGTSIINQGFVVASKGLYRD
jgi:hypothetical protein